MMLNAADILGESDASGAIKLLFGLAFLIIWGISAMVSWSKKTRDRQEQSGQQSWQEILQDLQGGGTGSRGQRPPPPGPYQYPPPIPERGGASTPMTPSQPRPRVAQTSRPAQRPPRQKRPLPPRREPPLAYNPRNAGKRTAAPPPIHRPAETAEADVETLARIELPATTVQRAKSPAALLMGKNLREQFILMELLRPPVTLRDDER